MSPDLILAIGCGGPSETGQLLRNRNMKQSYQDHAALKAAVLRLLGRREYSRRELEQRFQRQTKAEMLQAALDQLEADGYLSDQRFVESFVRTRVAQLHGERRIRHELRQKGIADVLVDAELQVQAPDWQAMASALVMKRFGVEPAADDKVLARRIRALMNQGYDWEQVRLALKCPESA